MFIRQFFFIIEREQRLFSEMNDFWMNFKRVNHLRKESL